MPEGRALAIFWLNKPHFQLLTQWAETYSLGTSIITFLVLSSLWFLHLGFSLRWCWRPAHVSSAGFGLFFLGLLDYCFGFGSFSSNACGLGSVNYASRKSRNDGSVISRGTWFWLRMWQLLKTEDSAEFEPAASTKPHTWDSRDYRYIQICTIVVCFPCFNNYFLANDRLLSWSLQCKRYHL